MQIVKHSNVIIALIISMFTIPSNLSNANENSTSVLDVTMKFDSLMLEWENQEIAKILLCPIILGGEADPFDKEKRLTFRGFGIIDENNARLFLNLIKKGEKEVISIVDAGIDLDLVVLTKKGGYDESINKIKCRLMADGAVLFVNLENNQRGIVKLPDKCFNLLKIELIEK